MQTNKTIKQLKEEFNVYFADLKESAKQEGYKVNRSHEWQVFLEAKLSN